MAEPLLSDLCSICTTNEPKYRCPGCAARTCSLPCYKRHQQRAQCSGKRDPTRYVKKSQLATPAGIDHDFNFLTSVERSLEKAERHVDDRGLSSGLSSDVRRLRAVNDRQFAAAGVTVIRAPKGLSRQKDNNTHRSAKGNIIWTVEWVLADKSRSLSNTSVQTPIAEAYYEHIGQKLPGASKKRKRAAESTPAEQGPVFKEQRDASTSLSGETERGGVASRTEERESTTSGRRTFPGLDSGPGGPGVVAGGSSADVKVEGVSDTSLDVNGTEPEPVPSQHNYFLLKPRTSSSHHVLIPIPSSALLGECLQGRTVLEFPTIYVFAASAPQLPDGFVLEEDYLKEQGKDQKEFQQLLKEVDPNVLQALKAEGGDDEATNEEFDSMKLLNVLKQDLGTAI